MKQWFKLVGSAICASLLTVTLSTGVFADFDDQEQDPVDPPMQIVDPVDGDLTPSDDNDGEPASPSSDDEDPAPGKKAGADADNDDGDNDDGDNDDGDNDDGDNDDGDNDDGDNDDGGNDDGDNGSGDKGKKGGAAADNDKGDKGDKGDGSGNDGDDNDDAMGDRAAAPNAKAAGDRSATNTDEGGSETGSESNGTETMFYQMEDGSYVLLNHDGEEALNADGDITILAAGVNHVSSISSTNKIRIAGTGILIVDDFQGTLESLTFTDIYEEGSVAVFARQADSYYHMLNGRVPGILDEDYLIKDYTLIMPENTKLLLCGTGATLQEDNTVLYYHGTDHDVRSQNTMSFVETTGNLTIDSGASLVVSQGASIILQNLRSVGGTNTYDGIRYPTLNTENGGTLVVDGTVGDGGFVNINGDAGALSGNGSVTAHRISVTDPGNVNGSSVTLSASELRLNGSGSYDDLHVSNSTVYISSDSVSFDGLNTSGDTTFILSDGCAFDLERVDGSLTLHLNQSYGSESFSNSLSSISGYVQGSGTINLYAGIYALNSAMTLDGVTISDGSAALVYDYAGLCGTSLTPLRIQPQNAPVPAATNDGGAEIAVVSSRIFENIHHVNSISFDGALGSATVKAVRNTSGRLILNLNDVKTAAETLGDGNYIVELLHKDRYGNFSTSFYKTANLSGTIYADDICLIRITFPLVSHGSDPATSPTQTGFTFTGSGILGGSGAGSVNYGSTNADPVDPAEPDPDEPDPDEPDPDEPDPDEPEPDEPDPDEPDPDEPDPDEPDPDEPDNEGASELWIEDAEKGCYVLLASEGEKTLAELGGKTTVSLHYSRPAKYAGKQLYAVFVTEDGTLKAFRATYEELSQTLFFGADCLGRFVIVGFDFDGVEFSEEFYRALLALSELAPLL